jgi:hypothetical protein
MQTQSKCPKGMIKNEFKTVFPVESTKLEEVWYKLNCRETFVDGQIFPYKVEFDAPSQKGPFAKGELNIHHGPLLSVHGKIGTVNDSYRSLDYFYGSYFLSFRIIRPVKLEFVKEADAIRLSIMTYVHPKANIIWNLGNKIFWKYFGIGFLLK